MFLPLPRDLVIPDGTGRFLANAEPLRPSAAPLIVSNSPEQVTERHFAPNGVALLHRAPAPAWRFRLFYHHQIAARTGAWLGYGLINHGAEPLELYQSWGSGPCWSRDPAAAGLRAWEIYLGRTPFAARQDRYVKTLPPGAVYTVLDRIDRDDTGTAIVDLALRDPSGRRNARSQLPVTIVTVGDSGAFLHARNDAAVVRRALLQGPLAAPDPARFRRTRATFAHADRTGAICCNLEPTAEGEPVWLDLAGPEQGAFARPLAGEYERALPSPGVDGALSGNPGNYGVVYDLQITLRNRFPRAVGVTCLLNAAGGPGGSALGLREGALSARTFLNAFDSWAWRDLVLAPGETHTEPMRFSLPGGANGAHRLYFWPRAIPG